jgi:uncharacterized repeat protein (TIGR01451 family)
VDANGDISYKPAGQFPAGGMDHFSYIIHDGTLSSSAATVNITLSPCSFTVTKSGTTLDGEADKKGDQINYVITISNTGDLPLSGIDPQDPLLSALSYQSGDLNSNNLLDTSESWIYSGTYILQQSDIDTNGGGDGTLDNTVTVTTQEVPEPVTASHSEPITCQVDKRAIQIIQN